MGVALLCKELSIRCKERLFDEWTVDATDDVKESPLTVFGLRGKLGFAFGGANRLGTELSMESILETESLLGCKDRLLEEWIVEATDGAKESPLIVVGLKGNTEFDFPGAVWLGKELSVESKLETESHLGHRGMLAEEWTVEEDTDAFSRRRKESPLTVSGRSVNR